MLFIDFRHSELEIIYTNTTIIHFAHRSNNKEHVVNKTGLSSIFSK